MSRTPANQQYAYVPQSDQSEPAPLPASLDAGVTTSSHSHQHHRPASLASSSSTAPLHPNAHNPNNPFSDRMAARSNPQAPLYPSGSRETSSSVSGNGVGRSNVGMDRSDEEGGVLRGELGGGYGPYAYKTTAGPSQEPLLGRQGQPNSRLSSNISDSSYDSHARYGAAAGGAAAGAAAGSHGVHHSISSPPTQAQPVNGTTTMLLWDNKDDVDDALHAPDRNGDYDKFDMWSARGWMNLGTIFVLCAALIVLFAGYPIISYYETNNQSEGGGVSGYNLGGINSSGQVPDLGNFPTLIDKDTPSDVYTRTGFDGKAYSLVFSDEFNVDGRTFYNGDDPFWEGADIHYWPTGDFEWYDPAAITTADGKLVITMEEMDIHGLNFRSGMLQGWNKFCISGSAYIEASVSLPGNNVIGGFWPGVWTMGNLGRPGYGATTEGTWPYSYDSCDVGTLKNQTNTAGDGPDAALNTGANGGSLSYLPGQRVSACTCAGEDHPGPSNNIGRGVPEIDIIEAQIDVARSVGTVSQSAQFAPYDDYYQFYNGTRGARIYDEDITEFNSYTGGVYQQAVSGLSDVASKYYADTSGDFNIYGVEWYGNKDDRDNTYITWVSSGVKSWTMYADAVGPNSKTEIGQRNISEEPMAMIINFGMSNNFQTVDFNRLTFPNHMYVDYIRIYQRDDYGTIGCDPADYPTADYIANHPDPYANANMTTWAEAGYTFPKNSLKDTC